MISISDKEFTTKKDCETYFKSIKDSLGTGLIEDKEIYSQLMSLLKRHEEFSEKVGCGIEAFGIRKNQVNAKYTEFYILRIDGSVIDFSYLHCIKGKKKSKESEVKSAFRFHVKDIIYEFKREKFKQGKIFSEISGIELTTVNSEVDHFNKSFNAIANEFIQFKGIENLHSLICEDPANYFISDESIINEWRKYHNENTTLRIISISENRELKK